MIRQAQRLAAGGTSSGRPVFRDEHCLPPGLVLLASAAWPTLADTPRRQIPVGVQLWTLRRETATDLAGTLKQVAQLGYRGVELWFQEWPAARELRQIVTDYNLQITSAHINLTDLLDDFPRVADYHREIGNRTLVVPFINNHQQLTADEWLQRIAEIRQVAQRGTEAGFDVLYHNHAFEFQVQVDGTELHQLLFASIDPKLLQAEIDVFFAADVGRDPAELVRQYAGRVKMLHLKEKSPPGEKAENTELGRGVIDWPRVFAAAEQAGVEWYLVEQNCEDRSALESIRISYEYLRSQGIVT